MFIPNHDKTSLINTDHIIRVQLSKGNVAIPGEFWLVADLTEGRAILHIGTQDDCLFRLAQFSRTWN